MEPRYEQYATVRLLETFAGPMEGFNNETQVETVERYPTEGDVFTVISEEWDAHVGCWRYNLQLDDGSGWRLWDVAEDDIEEVVST